VALAALLGVVLSLAGCVNIPTQGPVVDARRIEGGGGGGGLIQLFPAGPSTDAGPAELVREFLRASPTFTNDHEVARSFLAAGERLTWRPESPVIVYPGENSLSITVCRNGITVVDQGALSASQRPDAPSGTAAPTSTGASVPGTASSSWAESPSWTASGAFSATSPSPSTMKVLASPPRRGERAQVWVQAPVQARIDASGQYTMAFPGTVETREFELVGTEQGWRIATLDRGILVSRYDFDITFRSFPIYFADRTGTYLVPDVRWFPVSGTTSTPSQLLSTLLAGPASWLASSVVTGVPPATLPTVNSVKIADGVATVDLTKEARGADAHQRRILKAQLERTLSGLGPSDSPVAGVVVTVEQQRFELQPPVSEPSGQNGGDRGGGLSPPPQVDARPVVLDSRGAIARLSGRTVQPVVGLGALAVPGALYPAVDAGGQAYAVLTAGRSRLLYEVPSGQVTTLIVGHSLVAPSFDPFGWVWSAQEQTGGEVLAGRAQVGAVHLRAPWLAGLRIRSLRVSREGARVLVVAERPGSGSVVFVAGVVRNVEGVPQGLTWPMRLLADAVDATVGAWVDATHVVVVARRPGSVAMPWVAEVGGDVHGTLPAQAVAVTVGNSESDLYVQLASGVVRSRVGSSWSDLPGVRWPAMPG
jgi:hypothetical protein